MDLSLPALDLVTLGSAMPLQGLARCGSPILAYGLVCSGSVMLVLNFAHFESAMSTRSFT